MPPKKSATSEQEFKAFLDGWLARQEHYLDELLTAIQNCHESCDDDRNDLISRVLNHYQEYWEEKSRVSQSNIFLVCFPPWFSCFEHTFLWIGGFKPGLALRVLQDSVDDLSDHLRQQVSRLTQETRRQEKMLDEELARIQESMASPPFLQQLKRRGLRDGEVKSAEEEALARLRYEMAALLGRANSLRVNTVSGIVETLNPTQNVRFLTEVTQLQLKVRNWGVERDAEREGSSSG
ncbi:hypothetical protein Tsubulata_013490 [Turnera subulata]|uniref:DOG1 domain-containing protein n=1 Tax=Turnera subulata TaxID=218843 RepID=A0A9Q0FW26_9ROSI|nr:hypothetical protein Tsubulata_013490 [Turnera subulata]